MSLLKQAEQFFTALNAQDLDTAVKMISPSAEVRTPIGSFTGGKAYREWISMQFRAIPDFTHEIRGITVESDNTVAFELHAFGTHTGPMVLPSGEVLGTGNKINMTGADFWRIEDRLIVEYNLYFDRFEFLTQLGALPSS
ncbi:MAG: ester cyclase [Actinomycetota bacterium]|nr:ester cyclase [Actinomycetota bacterium]